MDVHVVVFDISVNNCDVTNTVQEVSAFAA